jgi:hypothetical protein
MRDAYQLPTYQTLACDNFKWYYNTTNRNTGLKREGIIARLSPLIAYFQAISAIGGLIVLCYGVGRCLQVFMIPLIFGLQSLKSCALDVIPRIDKNLQTTPGGESEKHLKKVNFTGRGLRQPIQHVDTEVSFLLPVCGLQCILRRLSWNLGIRHMLSGDETEGIM